MLAYFQNRQYEMAQNLALSIIKEFPNHNVSWKVLSEVYAYDGKMNMALSAIQNAIKINSKDAEAYNNMSLILFKLNLFEKAIKSSKKAIELKTDYAEAHNNLGTILQKLDKFEQAEFRFKKATALKSNFVKAHYNLGVTLHKLGKLEEAVVSYKKAIELKPIFSEAHYNLGIISQRLGKLVEAEVNYKKVIELKPNFELTYNNLGNTVQELGKLTEAEMYYRKAIELRPDNILAKQNLDILLREKEALSKIFQVRNFKKKSKASNKGSTSMLISNPFIAYRNVETDLIKDLYNINLTFKELDNTMKEDARYGKGRCSDFKLFKNDSPIIKTVEEDLISIMKKAVNSDIFIMESFFNIFETGSGIASHNHINKFDQIKGLIDQKFSLTYYLDVGDQNCDEPGTLKLYNPDEEILPSNGTIVIFPANRKHSAVYSGKTDRVMIGVNFYSLI